MKELGSALVFGGGSGLGAAAARKLAEAGYSVVVADLAADRAGEVAGEVGGSAVGADVLSPTAVEEATEMASGLPGGLRVLVNSAGVATPGKMIDKDGGPNPLGGFAKTIEVNLIGTVNALRLGAAAMAQNEPDSDGQRGVCVNTSSIAAFDGQIGQVAYAASKGGVASLTLAAARELAAYGIRVVTIAPGLFDTPLMAGLPPAVRRDLAASVPNPPRLGNPEEYASLLAHIAQNPMLNGETIRLDGALRMPPA